jgi:hypothetical protein
LNYALLHARGIDHLFDTMRYEPAFLVRRSDLDRIIATANDKLDFATARFSLLVCKPDDKGIKKASWWPQRLMSHQEYEYIEDHGKLFMLLGDGIHADPDFHAKKPLKWKGVTEITGTLAQVLTAIFDNNAFPAEEGQSFVIEQAFNRPDEKITVKIAAFFPTDTGTFVNLPKTD